MRTSAPQLLPIFRSDGQGRLLARIYLNPDRPAPIADLARELQLDSGGLTREADRLERAGLVRSERMGRNRVLHADRDSPYYDDLYGLLLKAFGPATLVAPELSGIPGIDEAYLYGSWAARYAGELGNDPRDVDVMVIGDPSSLAIVRAERELSERLGRDVNVVVMSPEEWAASESGFLREVKQRPLVRLPLEGTGPE